MAAERTNVGFETLLGLLANGADVNQLHKGRTALSKARDAATRQILVDAGGICGPHQVLGVNEFSNIECTSEPV